MRTVVVDMIFGSHLYGLNTPLSDKDYKQVYLPSLREILLDGPNTGKCISTGSDKTKNTAADVDTEYFSVGTFLDLASKGEMIAFDMLHAPVSFARTASPIWTRIQNARSIFYSKSMKAYLGYVRKQAAKYSCKGSKLDVLEKILDILKTKYITGDLVGIHWDELPVTEYSLFEDGEGPNGSVLKYYVVMGKKFQNNTRIELVIESLKKAYDGYGSRAKLAQQNQGLDWKAISHAFRAGFQLEKLFKEGDFTFPFEGETRQFLLDVKQGKADWNNLSAELDLLFKRIEEAAKVSSFPDIVDAQKVEELKLNIYRDAYNVEL